MLTGPIDLITVSREFGAGGSELAAAVGELLGWPVLDHALVHRVAERLELDPAAVERLDEHPPSRLARIATALLFSPPEAPVHWDTSQVLPPDAIADATRDAILEAAQRPPLVVVGHGSQSLFRERTGALHVRLVAPLESRVQRVCGRLGSDPRAAAAQARRMDDDRGRWVMRYYHTDWRDPLLYDLVFNTGRVAVAEAAALVARLVRSHGETAAPPS